MQSSRKKNTGIVVGWILSGNRENASSRLQGFLIHETMLRLGWHSELLASNHSQNASASQFIAILRLAVHVQRLGITHLIIENPEWPAVQVSQILRHLRVRIICVRCDVYPAQYDQYFDLTVLPTESLRNRLAVSKAAVIDDMVECDTGIFKEEYFNLGSYKKVRVVWVGHFSYSSFIRGFLSSLLEDSDIRENFEFITISRGPEFSRQWHESTVISEILDADIGIIPMPPGDWFESKSHNRLALMLSLGMPCIASPIDSYRQLIRESKAALFAETSDDFKSMLMTLRSPEARRLLGSSGRALVAGRFTPECITQRWMTAISGMNSDYPGGKTPSLKIRVMARLCAALAKFHRDFSIDSSSGQSRNFA